MLSIEMCKEILKTYDYRLSDAEVKQVREFLYVMAGLQIETQESNEMSNNLLWYEKSSSVLPS